MTLSPILRSTAAGLAAAALSWSAAQAADTLQVQTSSPAKDSFTTFPRAIRLTFNEPLKATGTELALVDPDGRRIRLGAPEVSGNGLTVRPELVDGPPVLGPYELTWQAQSAAGGAGQGRYTFFVQQP